MALSSELLDQLVKATKPTEKKPAEATVYGTTVSQDDKLYVQVDGSDALMPVKSTVKMKSGERVMVHIKDHSAVVTGNLTTQSARSDDVDDIVDEIAEFEIIIADKVSTEELDAERARIDELIAENVTITGRLEASEAIISELEADNVVINGTLTAFEAEIKKLSTEKLDADFAEITYATIENLTATNAQINNLEATYGQFVDLTTEEFAAVRAEIEILDAGKLSAEDADLKYANIDFANIGEAAVENFFAISGIVEDLVVSDGHITGTLTAVDINADYINTGTLKAERLVLLGEDGLFHEINVAAGAITEGEVVPDDGIHGSVITAKSITATQIFVDDLIAFGATIGGFNIGTNSLYSGVKESVDNSTRGIYMDTDGQVYFGDADNFLRYVRHVYEEPVEPSLIPNSVIDGDTGAVMPWSDTMNISSYVVSEPIVITDCDDVVITAWGWIGDYIYAFYDSDGNIVDGLRNASTSSVGITDETVSIPAGAETLRIAANTSSFPPAVTKVTYSYKLEISAESILFGANSKRSVADLQALTEHIKMGTYVDDTGNERPSIELAEGDTDFKQVITNTKTIFMDGDNVGTEINTDGLETKNATIRGELRQGNWVWAERANGNYGLIWKEATT